MVAQAPVPPHRVRLPDPTGLFSKLDDADRAFFVELVAAIQRELDGRPPFYMARPEVLLISPANKVYAVTVNDAGLLTTTLKYQQ